MQQVHFGGQDNSGVFCLTDSVLSGAFLLGAYIFVYIKKKRNCNHCAANIRRQRTQFSRSGDEEPGICAPTDLTFHAMSSYCSWKSWHKYKL